MKISHLLIRTLVPASFLFAGTALTVPSLHAQTSAQIADANKAALKDLDDQIDRLDDYADNAPSAAEKTAAKARIEVLKDRRTELRKNYVQARFDSLKSDVKNESDKLAAWSKKNLSPSAEARADRAMTSAERDADKANADAAAAMNLKAVTATADVAAFDVNPTEENKADAKASLAALDAEIKGLDDQADLQPKGLDRDAAKLRVKALKDRRSELGSDFRKARYDALVDDVKGEWRKLVH